MTESVRTSTSLALLDKRLQQELSTASDRATEVMAIGSRMEGLAIQGYDDFTAHKKDTRKVTAG